MSPSTKWACISAVGSGSKQSDSRALAPKARQICGSGVLLLYSWMSDAAKWSGLSQDERVKICLHDLSKYYADDPEIDVYEQYIESFHVLWTNEWCRRDAMYLPGQFSRFHETAKAREGQIFFAGEHLSKHHAWIAGAIDSAWRMTGEVLGRGVAALGREYFSGDRKRAGSKTAISSRLFEACIIPKHLNVRFLMGNITLVSGVK